MVELAGVDFVNGTLLNATKANETLGAGAGGLRRLENGVWRWFIFSERCPEKLGRGR